MSVASNQSEVSVSINGVEIPLDDAINSTFTGIQKHLNESQNNLRMLGTLLERDDLEFKDGVEYSDKIDNDVDEMVALFKNLKKITKQLVGRPSEEEKEWYRLHIAERKVEHLKKKNREKEVDAVAEE